MDARKLSLDLLEEKCREVHSLRKSRMTSAEIGEILGIHADTIDRWLKLAKHEWGYVRPGRKLGSGWRLMVESKSGISTH